MLPQTTVILGGARSGKSSYAERLIDMSGLPKTYIATAQVWDDEMRDRVDQHKTARGPEWQTIESPFGINKTLYDMPPGRAVLLDCVTLWLSNVMIADDDADSVVHINSEVDQLIQTITQCKSPVVVVSNEVGQGIVPENALARRFRDVHGRMNQRLAAQADLAVLVTAGLPLVLKGELPKGAK